MRWRRKHGDVAGNGAGEWLSVAGGLENWKGDHTCTRFGIILELLGPPMTASEVVVRPARLCRLDDDRTLTRPYC